jgi:hypothetical protein
MVLLDLLDFSVICQHIFSVSHINMNNPVCQIIQTNSPLMATSGNLSTTAGVTSAYKLLSPHSSDVGMDAIVKILPLEQTT